MSFATLVSRHRRSTLFLAAILVIAGGMSLIRLPVSLFPKVNYPRLRISLDAGVRPAAQMEIEVTRPVSLAIRSVPGVVNV
ncbi:MAG: efflux RND transporter permease subunit, partial [Acetobacteraceae bacterium]